MNWLVLQVFLTVVEDAELTQWVWMVVCYLTFLLFVLCVFSVTLGR